MSRPGPDGTPPTGGDFGDFLRHALHAAADQIEPRPDGLERIRARVRSGPAYASKHSAATKAAASGGFLAERVRRWNAMRGGSPAHGSPAHGSGRGHARRQPRDWRDVLLRSALAAACAVFAIGVALAVPPLRQALGQIGSAVGFTARQQQRNPGHGRIGRQPDKLVGRRCQSEQPPQQPGQRDGDRVPVEFFAVPLARGEQVAEPDREPRGHGEQPGRQQHERQPGQQQRESHRQHHRDQHRDQHRRRASATGTATEQTASATTAAATATASATANTSATGTKKAKAIREPLRNPDPGPTTTPTPKATTSTSTSASASPSTSTSSSVLVDVELVLVGVGFGDLERQQRQPDRQHPDRHRHGRG